MSQTSADLQAASESDVAFSNAFRELLVWRLVNTGRMPQTDIN